MGLTPDFRNIPGMADRHLLHLAVDIVSACHPYHPAVRGDDRKGLIAFGGKSQSLIEIIIKLPVIGLRDQ